MASLLRTPGPFRTLWWSRSVSVTGDGIGRTALVLLAAQQGATAVSLVLLAAAIPRFLGPLAGALADRVPVRRLMALCEIGQAAVFTAVAVLMPPLPVLLVLVLVSSAFATALLPAGRGVVPRLVPDAELGRANALLGMAFTVQLAVGPVVGGVLTEIAGPRVAFAVNAASFLLSALVLVRLPRLVPEEAGGPNGLWSDTVAGLRFVATSPGPRAIVASLFLLVSFAALDNVALVFLVEDEIGGSAADFGLVQTSYGIGMLGAAAVLGVVFVRRPAVLLVSGIGLFALGTAATSFAPVVAVAMVTQLLAGVGNAAENIASDTLVQRLVPRHLLGRAFGALGTAAQLGSALAYAAAGPLLAAIGPRAAFALAGVGSALGILLLAPALRERR
jgi:MFS family permease